MTYITYHLNKDTTNVPTHTVAMFKHLYNGTPYTHTEYLDFNKQFRINHTKIINTPHTPNNFGDVLSGATRLANRCEAFLIEHPDLNTQYTSFNIPKRSGGYRKITAPTFLLKELQHDILEYFKYVLRALPHNAAYAYVEHRSPKDALVHHQHADARWFLKLDLKEFFPSCTKEYILNTLHDIYPINFVPINELEKIIDVCMLNGGLPQGAPTSPIITNLIMVPIDKELTAILYQHDKSKYTYTRYADDMLISSPYSFKYTDILKLIQDVIKDTPFKINKTKTRYSSFNGRNWNLGLMYTNEKKITVGTERKKRVRSGLYNLFRDAAVQRVRPWSLEDYQILIGQMNYVMQIEGKEIFTDFIKELEKKFNITYALVQEMFK